MTHIAQRQVGSKSYILVRIAEGYYELALKEPQGTRTRSRYLELAEQYKGEGKATNEKEN